MVLLARRTTSVRPVRLLRMGRVSIRGLSSFMAVRFLGVKFVKRVLWGLFGDERGGCDFFFLFLAWWETVKGERIERGL